MGALKPLVKDRKQNIKLSYYYLYLLGVDPEYQNKGYGGNLLRTMINQTDKDRIPLYLETENESIVPFYEHFGFRVAKIITLPKINIPMWEMMRIP